ncbi:FE(2+)/MN(2+) TRANSPORTER PCL1 [Salix koriyanagi]|uniref:FE(2+)/MN(2+) TRANSPORTER PCL1 n=1 Tax=Salix koriyanagi TaxID=2511006 RepID=A0A9Q0TFN7_9ROSI|nr:FE(2+)/MN(2+) TRANSPORTER PCL1 [Salix koriyanagi]
MQSYQRFYWIISFPSYSFQGVMAFLSSIFFPIYDKCSNFTIMFHPTGTWFFSDSLLIDEDTASIIALSLAKLITGILTFAHKLLDLKSKQPRDRYQELLGRRENFLIHATIALLSFLVFGLVLPAVYGFTFMESTDDKNLKIVAVLVASLLCITILAIGKACIKKPTKKKFRIVLCYFVAGIKAAVVSYVVGDLAKKLIGKLGWFEPGKTFPLPLAEMSSGRLAWASY